MKTLNVLISILCSLCLGYTDNIRIVRIIRDDAEQEQGINPPTPPNQSIFTRPRQAVNPTPTPIPTSTPPPPTPTSIPIPTPIPPPPTPTSIPIPTPIPPPPSEFAVIPIPSPSANGGRNRRRRRQQQEVAKAGVTGDIQYAIAEETLDLILNAAIEVGDCDRTANAIAEDIVGVVLAFQNKETEVPDFVETLLEQIVTNFSGRDADVDLDIDIEDTISSLTDALMSAEDEDISDVLEDGLDEAVLAGCNRIFSQRAQNSNSNYYGYDSSSGI